MKNISRFHGITGILPITKLLYCHYLITWEESTIYIRSLQPNTTEKPS